MTRVLGKGGRHRAARARLSRVQRLTAGGLLLGASAFVAATWPTAAVADAPVQTGWWNTASGGGQAAPDPATPAGGLHVSAGSAQVLAYGAVLYAVPQGATATLELDVTNLAATPQVNPTAPTTAPQADVMACPTKSAAWKAGDDQPADAAPGYDCTRSFFGSLSADSKTLTFLVDSSVESVPGQLSLAIVPVLTDEIPGAGTSAPTDTTQPFALDTGKPDAASLTVTSTAALPPPPPKPAAGGVTSTGAGSTPSGAGATSSGGTTAPSSSGSVSLPPALTGSSAGSGATDPGTSPVVAPANSTPAATPAAAAAPTTNNRAHNAALAMLLLIGMGVVAMSSGQMQRTPRLLGGAGRHSTAAAAAAAAAALPAAAIAPMATYGNRGLGRFTKPRTEPARPLT